MDTNKKRIAICQSNYIPWRGYFELIKQSDVFVIYDEVQYTKNDWRNRNIIKTKQGLHWLTIPVKASISDKIDQVQTFGNHWRKKHWDTLYHHYRKATCFSDYAQTLEELYMLSYETNLSIINHAFIQRFCILLGISTRIITSSEIPQKSVGKTERLIEIVQFLNGNVYVSGEKAKAYLNQPLMRTHGIEVEWMNYTLLPEYNQLHLPFCNQVSIVDLLFNQGMQSDRYLLKGEVHGA